MNPESHEPIWTPSFILIWCFALLTFFSAFQLFPTAPLRLQELGSSLAHSGRFLAVFTLGSSVGALFTGAIGDRIGHRRMMILSSLVFMVISGIYGFTTSLVTFYCLAPIHGVVWSGILTSASAKAGSIIPESRRTQGFALYGLAGPMGVILGPTVGVTLYQHWGWTIECLGLVLCFGSLSLLGLLIPKDPPSVERHTSHLQKPNRLILELSSLLFVQAIAYGAMNSYSAQEGLGLQLRWPAAGLASMGLGMVIMRIVVGITGLGSQPISHLPRMATLATLGLVVLSLPVGGLERLVIAGLLFGAGYSMVFTLLNTALLDTVPEESRGTAFGTFMFAFDAGIGLGSWFLGYLIGTYSYQLGWSVGAFFMTLGIPLAYQIRRQRLALRS